MQDKLLIKKALAKIITPEILAKQQKRALPKWDILDNNLFIKSLFTKPKDDYNIHLLSSHYYPKFNTTQTWWNITGKISIHNIHNILSKVINRMVAGQPQNTRLQISVYHNDKTFTTKLLTSDEALDIVSGWVNMFIEYDSAQFEDIIFMLTHIELPYGTGKE